MDVGWSNAKAFSELHSAAQQTCVAGLPDIHCNAIQSVFLRKIAAKRSSDRENDRFTVVFVN